jgi:hypothetical protein
VEACSQELLHDPRASSAPAAATSADTAAECKVAAEARLRRRAGVGSTVVRHDDLEVLEPRAAVAVLVLDPRVREVHVPVFLVEAGTIRQLGRGLYDFPKLHPSLGQLSPTPEALAKAMAGRDRVRLQPSGAYAANLLGLSEQVPAKVVFLTDGPSRVVKVGPMTLQLRRTTPRNMAAAGRASGLVIQAFRHFGPEHITPERIARLRRTLPADDRRALLKDLTLAPEWMHRPLKELAS